MKRIQLEHTFHTSPEQLWEIIVDADYYRFWTEAFSVSSDFVGEWSEGSKIRFVTTDDSGNESGMLSEIVASVWPEFISIRHLGLVMNGVEDYDSPTVKEWTPAFENYRLIKKADGMCTFELVQDIPKTEVEMFIQSWQKAFERIALLLGNIERTGKVITLMERSSHRPAEIWDKLVTPEKVMTWNFASNDWHCPKATNDLVVGGEFHYEMAAVDGSMSFDFWGTFTEIEIEKQLNFKLGDGRNVSIEIIEKPYGCLIEERFEPELENNLHLQRSGWQSILKRLAN